MRKRLASSVIMLIFLVPLVAAAAPTCAELFLSSSESSRQSAAVRSIVLENAFEQWRRWEGEANIPGFRKPRSAVPFDLKLAPTAEVEVWRSSIASPELEKFFLKGDFVLWPSHPYNESDRVPFASLPSLPKNLPAWLTASRSAVPVELAGYTMKTATDRPHGRNDEPEPSKLETGIDIRDARLRTEFLLERDASLGEDPVLIKLLDIFALIDKSSRNGVLFRDISILNDGHYYLPALSIPYVGRAIAELHRMTFEDFFGEAYAATLGRAKARLLMRYGLQMETPNPQNFLIQLDRNLRPTGRIVIRDLSDSYFVEPVAERLNLQKFVEADRSAGLIVDGSIDPRWQISRFLFDQAGEYSIPRKTFDDWEVRHDIAFVREIERLLNVSILPNVFPPQKQWWSRFSLLQPVGPISILRDYLDSPEGASHLHMFQMRTEKP